MRQAHVGHPSPFRRHASPLCQERPCVTTFPLNRKAGRATTPAGTPFRGVKPRRLFRRRRGRGYQPRRERAEHCLALRLAGLPTAFYLRHTPALRGFEHPADLAGHRITSPAPSELPGLATVSTNAVTSLGRVTGRSNNACTRLPPGHSFRPLPADDFGRPTREASAYPPLFDFCNLAGSLRRFTGKRFSAFRG